MNIDDFKKCPMCGESSGLELDQNQHGNYRITCNNCSLIYGYYKYEALLSRWNKRKDYNDGHHTFQELYDHRRALTTALAKLLPDNSIKSLKHNDNDSNPMFDDSFIVVIDLPEAGQISYHYKSDYFDGFPAKEVEEAPKWDGHTPNDVCTRLLKFGTINSKE